MNLSRVPFASLAAARAAHKLADSAGPGKECGPTERFGSSTFTHNAGPGRSVAGLKFRLPHADRSPWSWSAYGKPQFSASGASPPNPQQGRLPLHPAFVGLFLRGGRPRDPQRSRRSKSVWSQWWSTEGGSNDRTLNSRSDGPRTAPPPDDPERKDSTDAQQEAACREPPHRFVHLAVRPAVHTSVR